MGVDIAAVWEKFKVAADPEAKAVLVEYYLPFVRNIALGVIRKIRPGVVDLDDLISDGSIGLIHAIEQFDPGRGIKFETYALPVVRGAVYNGVRSLDWVPERTREKARALQKAMDNFSITMGREGTEAEIAEQLNMETSEVYNLIADMGCVYLLSLDQPLASDDDDSVISDFVEDSNGEASFQEIEFAEQRAALFEAIDSLPERDAKIIRMHYFSGCSFERIASEIGITKQRVSQLHSRIIRQLRKSLSGLDVAVLGGDSEPQSFLDFRA